MNRVIAIAGAGSAALFAGAGFLSAYPAAKDTSQTVACELQAWPNYKAACVRNGRQAEAVRQVRIVPLYRLTSSISISHTGE